MIESYTVEVVVVKYIHCEEAHGFTRTVQRYEANDLEVVGVFKTLAKAQGLLKNIYSLANGTEIWSHGSGLHPRFLDWRDGMEGCIKVLKIPSFDSLRENHPRLWCDALVNVITLIEDMLDAVEVHGSATVGKEVSDES